MQQNIKFHTFDILKNEKISQIMVKNQQRQHLLIPIEQLLERKWPVGAYIMIDYVFAIITHIHNVILNHGNHYFSNFGEFSNHTSNFIEIFSTVIY